MDEAQGVCKDRSMLRYLHTRFTPPFICGLWRSIFSAYPHGKKAWFVCMLLCCLWLITTALSYHQFPTDTKQYNLATRMEITHTTPQIGSFSRQLWHEVSTATPETCRQYSKSHRLSKDMSQSCALSHNRCGGIEVTEYTFLFYDSGVNRSWNFVDLFYVWLDYGFILLGNKGFDKEVSYFHYITCWWTLLVGRH